MIDVAFTRRENLQKIRQKRFTSNADLARAIERSPSQVNDILSGAKSFGPRIARSIEEKLKLTPEYLDEPHSPEKTPLKFGKKSPSCLLLRPEPGPVPGTTHMTNGCTFQKTHQASPMLSKFKENQWDLFSIKETSLSSIRPCRPILATTSSPELQPCPATGPHSNSTL